MADAISVIVKALAGGSLVVVFALVSEALVPKRFAGLFGAAPAVAIAGLDVTLVSKGVVDARHSSLGMVAGSAGMAAHAAATVVLLKRARSLTSSVAGRRQPPSSCVRGRTDDGRQTARSGRFCRG